MGNVRDGSVGRDLVNKIFGKAGTLAKYFTEESEREGYRDLFAGVVGAFRNPSAHRLIDPNPEEGGAYIVFVNLLLKHLARFTQPGPTTREAFLAACGDDAAPFFGEVLNEASERHLKVSFGGKGFSVRVPKRPPFFYCFPPGANGRATSDIELFLEPVRDPTLHKRMRSKFLEIEGTKASGDYTIRLTSFSSDRVAGRSAFSMRTNVHGRAAAEGLESSNSMTLTEQLMLAQTIIMAATGAVLIWYTIETKRLRAAAGAQFEVMRRTYALQLDEMKRAAEPIFVWGAGSSSGSEAEWEFVNQGGPISNLTVTLQSPNGTPTGISATIEPTEWLGAARPGRVRFSGAVRERFHFTIGFRTRIGSVGGFFFSASNDVRPINTGNGWI